MTLLTELYSRQSIPQLTDPAPSPAILEQLFHAADRAPDHGVLKPWRFSIIQNQGREKLGQLFLTAAQQTSETPLTAEQSTKLLAMPLRAPMIIVVSAHILSDHKIPATEQLLAVGAAVQNLLLAIHALGYAAMWRTGDMAYHPTVKKAFDLAGQDAIVGFIYVGTPAKANSYKKIAVRPMSEFVSYWKP